MDFAFLKFEKTFWLYSYHSYHFEITKVQNIQIVVSLYVLSLVNKVGNYSSEDTIFNSESFEVKSRKTN